MSNVLQIDRNGIDEAVNDLQELINEINEVNISKSKQEGDEGMAYTAIQEGEKIIENVKLIIDSENQNKNLNHGTYTDEHLMKHLKSNPVLIQY